jgi:flagellar protein FliL
MAEDEADTETKEAAPATAKGASPWPPLLAVLILMPAVSYAMTQYVLLPKIRGSVLEQKAGAHAAKAESGGHGKSEHGKGEGGAQAAGFSYDFDNPDIKKVIEENKKQLLDVTLTILGTRTLADLEQPGAKNVVRNDLMTNINDALKSDLVKQIYFSEFVVQ